MAEFKRVQDLIMQDQIRQREVDRAAAVDLVAECLAPLPEEKGMLEMHRRTHRLLAAILLRLT